MSDRKFYKMTHDVLFKYVFGRTEQSRILMALVNALLQLKGKDEIKSIELLNPYNYQGYVGDKLSILDIKAKDGNDVLYNIEMQVDVPDFWSQRVLFYASKLYSSQLEEKKAYKELNRTISISILDDTIFPEYEELHNSYRFRHDKDFSVLGGKLIELHFIELPKYKKDKPRSMSTKLEKWLHALSFSELYEEDAMPKELESDEFIKKAIESLRCGNSDRKVRELIEAREKYERDYISREVAAEDRGERKGLKKGREEREREMAKTMKEEGSSIEFIQKVTGLSKKEIKKL